MIRRIVDMSREQGPRAVVKHAWESLPWARSAAQRQAENEYLQGAPGVLMISGCPGGSRRYRCEQPGQQLRGQGVPSLVTTLAACRPRKVIPHTRAVILHRVPWTGRSQQVLRLAHQVGIPVVFDGDDRVLHPSHVDGFLASRNASGNRGARGIYHRYFAATAKMIAACETLWVSTEALAQECRQRFPRQSVHVVPNLAGDGLLRTGADAHQHVVPRFAFGYFSGTATHDRDFAGCSDALSSAMTADPKARLLVLGPVTLPANLSAFASRIEHQPDPVPYEELPGMLAQARVHLAPLCGAGAAGEFVAAKSAVKWMEAAAVSRPLVTSAIGELAERVTEFGGGRVCANGAAWRAALADLTDPDTAAAMGIEARQGLECWAEPARAGALETRMKVLGLG